jgi:hypothetical protein
MVNQCPNVVYYKDNEHFKPTEEYLDEDTINWGNHTNRCECGAMRKSKEENGGIKTNQCPKCGGNKWGARSVMLAAVKIIYTLGFRKLFIVGADFKMDDQTKYAWNQDRSNSSVKSNNDTYDRLNLRFSQLRPIFESRGFYVFNATPDSGLNSFVKIPFEDAVKMASAGFPETKNERTYGMYERKSIDKKIEDGVVKVEDLKEQITKVNGSNPKLTKRLALKIEKENVKLRSALEEKERILSWTV